MRAIVLLVTLLTLGVLSSCSDDDYGTTPDLGRDAIMTTPPATDSGVDLQ